MDAIPEIVFTERDLEELEKLVKAMGIVAPAGAEDDPAGPEADAPDSHDVPEGEGEDHPSAAPAWRALKAM